MVNEPLLLSGNEALGEGAIRGGCRFFYGYPITPQGELFEYLARRLPEVGGTFLQSESEIAAINMVYGTAATGKRVMTASSSPGISLMQEGLSYLAATQLPCLIVNIMRAGPGLGRVRPSQADYLQATKGGGHGDYHMIVLAPASAQEMADLGFQAFALADNYRTPVMILGDGMLGQTMESVALPEAMDLSQLPPKPWAVTGARGRERNLVLAAPYTDDELITLNAELEKKYASIEAQESRWESKLLDDAEVVIVAFGTSARIAEDAVLKAREKGLKVGLIRPITLWPFPKEAFDDPRNIRAYIVVEMNNGQMLEDVRLAKHRDIPVYHFGHGGGWVPSTQDVYREVIDIYERKCVR
ncbi:MAG: 3-methyl-2-oxobutanoate dehydrogenase subunit VorB [Candidatus Bathyarchaeia archaeon]